MIIGLDISTTCIGFCILTDQGDFYHTGHLMMSGDTLNQKAIIFDAFLYGLKNLKNMAVDVPWKNEEIKYIFIEDALKKFSNGFSNAKTLAMLQSFNSICSYMIFDRLQIEPIKLSVLSARKMVGLSLNKQNKDKKTQIVNFVRSLNIVPESYWAYKKTGKFKDWCGDQADAWVIAKAGIISLSIHEEKKIKPKKSRKKSKL